MTFVARGCQLNRDRHWGLASCYFGFSPLALKSRECDATGGESLDQ